MDLRQADTLDPNWWSFLRAFLLQRENQAAIPILRDRLHQKFVNLRGLPVEAPEYRELWDECLDLRQHISNAVWPWASRKVLTKQEKIDYAVDQYRREIGDPNDPAYAYEIERQLHFWKTGEMLPEKQAA